MQSRAALAFMLAAAGLLACTGGDDSAEPFGQVGTAGGATTAAVGSSGTSSISAGSGDSSSGPGDPTLQPIVCEAPEVACGVTCVDLDSDPNNCGLCGRSCVITNAQAACAAGECMLDSCDPGFSDCDGLLETGCEAAVDCSASACETACGSTGTQSCDDSCAPICVPPVETCNAIDDDCNAACDEGPLPACRAGVHRSYSPTLGHFYTTDRTEASSGDFTLEAASFFHLYVDAVDGLVPLFRCLKGNGRRFYTSSIDCETTGAPELTVGFMSAEARCDSSPLYRVYQAGSDSHFYTTSAAERDNAVANLGYTDQGVAGHIWLAP